MVETPKRLFLSDLLPDFKKNNDNLHRIAISNVFDGDRVLARWWVKKYKTPLKKFEDQTHEELMIEMLEDFYDNNRTEIDRFQDSVNRSQSEEEWDGKTSQEYEEQIQKRLNKIKKIDLTRFQSEEDESLTPEEEQRIIDSLSSSVPSKKVSSQKGLGVLGEDEFEDSFGD